MSTYFNVSSPSYPCPTTFTPVEGSSAPDPTSCNDPTTSPLVEGFDRETGCVQINFGELFKLMIQEPIVRFHAKLFLKSSLLHHHIKVGDTGAALREITMATEAEDLNFKDGIHQKTPLINAIEENNIEVVHALIAAGADPNIKNGSVGDTALMCALQQNRLEIIPDLIKAGADLNIQNNEGDTALMCALQKNRLEIIPYLIKAGADLNIKNKSGDTPLMCALQQYRLQIIPDLIEAGADCNCKNSNNITPLRLAVGNKQRKIVKILLKAGADPNFSEHFTDPPFIDPPLIVAIREGYDQIAQLLIDNRANLNIKNIAGATPLSVALKKKRWKIAEDLFAAGADPALPEPQKSKILKHSRKLWRYALFRSPGIQFIKMLIMMFDKSNIPDNYLPDLWENAINSPDSKLLKILINKGLDLDVKISSELTPFGLTPLMRAIEIGNIKKIRMLIEAGANLNVSADPDAVYLQVFGFPQRYLSGMTPLNMAANRGRYDIVELLLSYS